MSKGGTKEDVHALGQIMPPLKTEEVCADKVGDWVMEFVAKNDNGTAALSVNYAQYLPTRDCCICTQSLTKVS